MNLDLNDLSNICYNDWKSRQHVKKQEDNYKKHIASNPAASGLDELLNKLKFNLLNKELKNYINK